MLSLHEQLVVYESTIKSARPFRTAFVCKTTTEYFVFITSATHLVLSSEILQSSCDESLGEEKPTQPENGGSDAILHPRPQEVQPKEEVSNPRTKWH